ncbi:hypothetical protein TSUD_114400 [Trifolium subterraneum]|uniref:Uncharacterized protein n=1 Tax=Trifolium subterraneum TaxID=3900 RepID=A0A2Z6MVW3_TRISU|nr:hypothetical protein TSUD_114400 [Trifolium subterraneum]
MIYSVIAEEVKLFDMRSSKDVKLHRFNENGVKRRHEVLKKGTRRVKDVHHGAYRKTRKKEERRKGFEV